MGAKLKHYNRVPYGCIKHERRPLQQVPAVTWHRSEVLLRLALLPRTLQSEVFVPGLAFFELKSFPALQLCCRLFQTTKYNRHCGLHSTLQTEKYLKRWVHWGFWDWNMETKCKANWGKGFAGGMEWEVTEVNPGNGTVNAESLNRGGLVRNWL